MSRESPIPDTVTLQVPFRVVKRGGRKEMQLPEGAARPSRTDGTLVKALARAFRWKRMLEAGEFATIAELAECEGIAPSYMTRVLRLTLLAPDIVEAILDGKQGPTVTLARVLKPFPVEWNMRAEDVTDTIELALAASGCDQAVVRHKPRLLSDNGSCYISGDLAKWLEDQKMDHVRGAPFHPQTQGKIERWHQTMKNRVLLENYYLPGHLERQIGDFVDYYNNQRYHESLKN
ncbi:Integrase core domain-containing protein, partial [Salinihabitans flavidus]